MDLNEVKSLFAAGELIESIIEPYPSENGWKLLFKDTQGETVRLTSHGGEERVFRSLDMATEIAIEVGFEITRIEVTLSRATFSIKRPFYVE